MNLKNIIIIILLILNIALICTFQRKNYNPYLIQNDSLIFLKEDSLKKAAFVHLITKECLIDTLEQKNVFENRRLIIYAPANACGVCLEKFLNYYWDSYFSKISRYILIISDNPYISNIFYIRERLIDFVSIKKQESNGKLIRIFFFDKNQKVRYEYLYDEENIKSFETYISGLINSMDK